MKKRKHTSDIDLKRAICPISTLVKSLTHNCCLSNGKVGSWLRMADNISNLSRIIWNGWILPVNQCCRFPDICRNWLIFNTNRFWCFAVYKYNNVNKLNWRIYTAVWYSCYSKLLLYLQTFSSYNKFLYLSLERIATFDQLNLWE